MFEQRLKEAIKKSGKNQKQMAIDLGVSQATMSRYIRGERLVTHVEKIQKLCKSLGVTPNYLFGWEEEADSLWCQIEE